MQISFEKAIIRFAETKQFAYKICTKKKKKNNIWRDGGSKIISLINLFNHVIELNLNPPNYDEGGKITYKYFTETAPLHKKIASFLYIKKNQFSSFTNNGGRDEIDLQLLYKNDCSRPLN